MRISKADRQQISARNMRKTRQGMRKPEGKPYLKIGLLTLGVLLLAALLYDLSHMERFQQRNPLDPVGDIQPVGHQELFNQSLCCQLSFRTLL